jgi:triacylglycerol lipase
VRRLTTAALAALLSLSALAVGPAATPAAAAPTDPVILVAGTFAPAFSVAPLAARLEARGYDTHVFTLPALGTIDIRESARALNAFADQVRARTGAARVDMIGHSQGGLTIRTYVKYEGGAAEVDSAISLGTPHYGTVVANLAELLGFGSCIGIVACQQMAVGSSFLADLNAGDDTVGSVRYTNIYTVYDELVRPVDNATMRDGATNVRVQSQCLLRVVGHVGLVLDGAVADGIADALRGDPVRLNCWAL